MELHQRVLLSTRLLLGGALLAATLAAQGADFANLSRLAGQGARVTALVADLQSDQVLAQLEPGQRLIPASLSKIVIAAAALDTWPPDHTFATELRAAAAPVDGVVSGDLVLRSEGDATLDETTLWGLAAQLRAQGVRRINGRVLVERAPFGELGCDTIDRCSGMRRSARAYNAAPSAIGVNYGSWCINVRAPTGASHAEVGGCATGTLPVPLSGSVQVAASGAALDIERSTGAGGDRISVSGTVAPGSDRSVHRAMSDPAAGAGLILRSILQQTGVVIDGGVDTAVQATSAPRLLASVDGLLLQEQVGRMMRWSNNYIADVLTMGVALARNGIAPQSLAEAARTLTAFMGAPGPVMESGSGLTTTNRLSAQDLVSVLRVGYRNTRRFPALYGSFVAPGDASFTYLRSGNTDWQNRVALKTGSLTDPVSVNGIAGYLRRKDGGWMAFAIIVNGSKGQPISHERALAAARTDLEAVLARY
ncbi:MAG: D-alanyl-D-alanine carboxypeptidase/D-alanyl-D-alanine-endopeptidase [Steroidobacteraceae bacterium]